MKTHDVLVVGAGPAGSTAALHLARAGFSVAIAEREVFPRGKVCGEFVSGPSWTLLDALGVADALRPHAGPPVEAVGFHGGEVIAAAPMPGTRQGRAIGRHRLDAVLLDAAIAAGAHAFQPAIVQDIVTESGLQRAHLRTAGESEIVVARHVIDAHGSWLRGPFAPLPSASPRELLGFKARFADAALPRGLMPLVVFPGGYGGLVETGAGLVSFSCCIRRDVMRELREGGDTAGAAVFAHVLRHCRGVREALGGARLADGEGWRGAGPIHPGVRPLTRPGVLAVGNAAGEAHPLVAEGISMALQSGWLAAHHLVKTLAGERTPAAGARAYARDWRAHFLLRIRASQAFAAIADRGTSWMGAAVSLYPGLLTAGALLSGKSGAVPALDPR